MVDLHRLRIFRAVVAGGSVHAAAINLDYTPSAISQHLTALQRETGLVLLERVGRGLRPTPAGLALAADADDVLARLGETDALIADLRSGRTGRLSIAYFASVGAVWLPPVVRRITRDFPGVRLRLRLSDEMPGDPDERADLHLMVARDGFTPGAGFTMHHLVDDPYVAVVPDTHPLAGSPQVDLPELATECWIDNDFSGGWCRRNLLDSCAAAGFSPPFFVETHDYRSAMAFVAAGVGITVLPALGAADPPPGVTPVPIVRPTPVRSIHLVVRRSVEDTPPGRLAIRLLRDAAA